MKSNQPTITRFAIILAACLALPVLATNEQPPAAPPPPPPSEQPKKPNNSTDLHIIWAPSYDHALQSASKENKPVMADFYADWNIASHHLDDNIFTSSDVINESRKFINVRIDADKQENLTKLYKVYASPTIIFMDGNGNVLTRLEGAPEKSSYFVEVMQKTMHKFEAENKSGSHQ